MRMVCAILIGTCSVAVAAAAETTAPKAEPQCETAEINPVTGHVLCIKPLGAPPDAKLPCKQDSRGQWSWAPNCTPVPEGM